MTREEFKQDLKDDVDAYGKPRKLMGKVDRLFDEHEEQLKAKAEEIERLKKLVNDFNNTYSVGDFDFESYYAMLKENNEN